MKEIIKSDKKATMSSLDLRDIINAARVEHQETEVANRHFLARIEDELEGELVGRKTFTPARGGTPMGYYDLTRDQCTLVGMRESKAVRRKVLERLTELEQTSTLKLPNFSNPVEAARAWADEVEAKQAAVALIEQQKPAVEFVERYVAADSGSKGFRQVAKLLNANERAFRAFLSDSKIMYKLGGEWMPYQCHADAGRFEVKGGVADNEHAYNSALFTPKGINWIAGLWAQHCLKSGNTECRSSL